MLDHTRSRGSGPIDEKATGGPFGARVMVRVTCLRSAGGHRESTGELGVGQLIDPLAVGSPLRIQMEQTGPALVTSPVRGVERIGLATVQVVTGNSVYRLELAGTPSPLAPSGPKRHGPRIPARSERLAQLRECARSRFEAMQARSGGRASPPRAEESPRSEATCFVSIADLPRAPQGPFAPGARVWIHRRKTSDPSAEFERVGSGRVLDRLEAGEPARIAVDGGPTFVTSPLRKLRLLDPHHVEFETANTIYRLERLQAQPSMPSPRSRR